MPSLARFRPVPHPWTTGAPGRSGGNRVLGLLAVALLALLTACGSPTPAPTAVVIAATAGPTEPGLSLDGPLAEVLRVAVGEDRAHLQVLVAAPRGAQPILDRDLVLHRGAEVEHDGRRRQLTDDLLAEVDTQLRQAASPTGRLDLLGLLTDVGRTPGEGTVLVRSSGLQTAAPVALDVLGWEFDPARVVDDLARHGYLPDLRGKDVTFSGLGQVAGAQAPLPTPLRARLEALWTTICHRASAAGCRVEDRPLPGHPPASTASPVLVPVPTVTSVVGGTTALPTALLFAPDSAVLLADADADAAVAPVAAALRNTTRTATVVGHTASVGPAEGARTLSTQRAHVLADALVRLGVRPDQITAVAGVGFDRPLTPDRDATGGLLPDAAARNRAVVVSVGGGA